MLHNFAWTSAIELRRRILSREISPVEVIEASLARLEEVEPKINAFVDVTRDQAHGAAKECERALLAGEPVGLLAGLPVSVKDLISVKGARMTFGSKAFEHNLGEVDAPSVERVRRNHGAIVGKTTTSEFGCKGTGTSPLTGVTRNPWNLSRTPGGSSAGAGASVAAGVTPFALATDGGGSTRVPASFCGLFGIKAQFGRVPVWPTSATPTLAHVAPIARTVRDAALLLQAVAGYDSRDAGSVSQPLPDFLAACELPPRRMKVAWSPTFGFAKPKPEIVALVAQAVKVLEGLGCDVELVEHLIDDPIDLFMAEFFAGAGTRLRSVIENDRDLLDPPVARTLEKAINQEMGVYYTSVFARYDLRQKFWAIFQNYDLIVTPTLPTAAFAAEADYDPAAGSEEHMVSWVSYTYAANLVGIPAASIPVGFTADGMPVGMQILGKSLGETDILSIAAAYEAVRPWAHNHPPLA